MSSSQELHAALGQESSVVDRLRLSLEEEVRRREEAERNVSPARHSRLRR